MRELAGVAQWPMKWTQPSALKQEYDLCSGEDLLATLRFRSSFGTFATAESADGCWTFKRIGFWQSRATIRLCDSDKDVAVFTNNTWRGGGVLEFADGARFLFTTNFWRTQYEVQSEEGEVLVRFSFGGVFHYSSEVEVASGAAELHYLPLLVLFGWYIALMLQRDSAAAVVAAT